ncbi:MAG: hypothetical protein GQ558_00830 [Thermoplasmata archaeon]|nr:hypothetical protein [Thermoplasmata archaeon]
MGDRSVDAAEVDSLKRKVNHLWRMRWFKVGVSLLILVMLVGHMVVIYNAANSLEVESVRVTEILPGSIDGDFTVVFEITLLNPTSGTIEVERLNTISSSRAPSSGREKRSTSPSGRVRRPWISPSPSTSSTSPSLSRMPSSRPRPPLTSRVR